MILFDGKARAKEKKARLKEIILQQFAAHPISIFSLVFAEDEPSMIYARLKQKDAMEIGIDYRIKVCSLHDPYKQLAEILTDESNKKSTTGMIIQKPSKTLLTEFAFEDSWQRLVDLIPSHKDVDGLTGRGPVLPATAAAILEILDIALENTKQQNLTYLVLGRSEIVGAPVARILQEQGKDVTVFGRKELAESCESVKDFDVVITATGQPDVLSADDIKQGAICIDAGSPKPEINPQFLETKAAFLSPVPGGVGPMTRVCLLENAVNCTGVPHILTDPSPRM
jgi:methylenetetrahydrofolate dehydrogenase (NADP+)/methenyltetrahydrofolate cyclohydrolase